MRRMAILIAGLLFSGFSMASASAHAELVSMNPVAGSTVTTSPASVQLTFGEDVADLGSTIVVLDPLGNAVQIGDPHVAGAVIAIDLRPLTDAGTYHVNFRVLSRDGHVVNGAESFDYAPAVVGSESTNATASPDASILVPSPETSAVTANDSTIAFWMTGFLMAFGILAAVIAWRAKR